MALCTVVRFFEGGGMALFEIVSTSIVLDLTPDRYSGKVVVST